MAKSKKNHPVCNLCRARLRWAKTIGGNLIPLDYKPVENGNYIVINDSAKLIFGDPSDAIWDGPKYTNHHATCMLDRQQQKAKE